MVKPLAAFAYTLCRQKCGYAIFFPLPGRKDLVKPYLAAWSNPAAGRGKTAGGHGLYWRRHANANTRRKTGRTGGRSRKQQRLDPAAGSQWKNPGTFTLEQLRALRAAGSIVSASRPGRSGSSCGYWGEIILCGCGQEASFTNLNLDLIYRLPGQAVTDWKESWNGPLP